MNRMIKITMAVIAVMFIAIIMTWGMLPGFLSSTLSQKAGVPVRIGSMQVSPISISLDDIEVSNPQGSKLPKAFSAGEISVEAPLHSYLNKAVVIDEIEIETVYIDLEFDKKGSTNGNWSYILNNLGSSGSSEETSDTSLLIKKLLLTDIQVDLVYKDTGQVQKLKPIKKIELTNISSKGGIPSQQIANIVLKETIRNTLSIQGLQNLIKGLVPDTPSGFFEGVKGIFGEASECNE